MNEAFITALELKIINVKIKLTDALRSRLVNRKKVCDAIAMLDNIHEGLKDEKNRKEK